MAADYPKIETWRSLRRMGDFFTEVDAYGHCEMV